MEQICALALCLLLSLCSATSPPKIPILTPLNCNETNALVGLATDLINEDRDGGFLIKPFRTRSIFEQKVEKIPGASLYYIDFDAKETGCSVLSGKKWKDCDKERSFHEKVDGECKTIMYISKPWRILKTLSYNCTLGTVPSRTIVSSCPDCPVIVRDISPSITEKAKHMVEAFNQESNQTNLFKLDEIERVRSQWMLGQSYFISFIIKETDCLKTQKDVILDNCKSLSDSKAHVGFCTGSAYNTPEKQEKYSVSCEIYDPRDDDHHHHHHHHGHGSCDHGKEGTQVEESKDNVGHSEAGAGEVGLGEAGQGQTKDLPKKCELGKGKDCGQHRGHRHHCHPGHHHHHHHHHHPGHHHDHQSHSHPHDPAHHHHPHHHDHHNHTADEHGSSSEENTNKQPFKRTKGSVQVYYLDEETLSPPVPTIVRLPGPSKHVPEVADFPSEASPLKTCPSEPY
ncbi:fetuin-B-like [Lithobates pipiens]